MIARMCLQSQGRDYKKYIFVYILEPICKIFFYSLMFLKVNRRQRVKINESFMSSGLQNGNNQIMNLEKVL